MTKSAKKTSKRLELSCLKTLKIGVLASKIKIWLIHRERREKMRGRNSEWILFSMPKNQQQLKILIIHNSLTYDRDILLKYFFGSYVIFFLLLQREHYLTWRKIDKIFAWTTFNPYLSNSQSLYKIIRNSLIKKV